MIECNCDNKFQRNWPFMTTYCVHGKRLLNDKPIEKSIPVNTIPDSVMNIIRTSGTIKGNNK